MVALTDLPLLPYISEAGTLPPDLTGKVGVYAIRDREKTVCYIGYSRDVEQSLKLHLVRQVDSCYWVQVHCVDRPSRTYLEGVKQAWIEALGHVPTGNASEPSAWETALDINVQLSDAERSAITDPQLDEVQRTKRLKQAVRLREAAIVAKLAERNLQIELRFNPKLKDQGLLDLR